MGFCEELFGLEGKVAVVIGGGGVLAGAMAEGLALAGARVAIVDLNAEKAGERSLHIREQLGRQAMAVQADAARKASLVAAREEVLAEWGRVDIVVNAPGINSATPFMEITEEEWDLILNVNLKSVFNSSQSFGAHLVEQGEGGSVINISSASSGPPLSKVFTYSISKAGVDNLTRFLAREWAPHAVRVNAIRPGFFPAAQNRKILTEERVAQIMGHTPMARFGEANELVGAALWLASDKASSFVTGAIIPVDGGFSAMSI